MIAYEPVWAIGTGTPATPKDVESAAHTIRRQIEHLYGKTASESVRVLYGASTTASSAKSYLEVVGINGLLPGGASLKLHEFSEMVEIAHKVGRGKKV